MYLNEIEPNNVSGLRDQQGAPAPWVEFNNGGTNIFNLAGCYLSDDFANPAQWAFPTNASIGPGGYLLVWLDGAGSPTTANELHSSFRVPLDSGNLALAEMMSNQPVIIDYVKYQGLGPDQSYGSAPERRD